MTRRLSALVVAPSARALRVRRLRDQTGAATAEYAVVSVAAAGLGGLLIKLLTSDWFLQILKSILEWILTTVLHIFGLGG